MYMYNLSLSKYYNTKYNGKQVMAINITVQTKEQLYLTIYIPK